VCQQAGKRFALKKKYCHQHFGATSETAGGSAFQYQKNLMRRRLETRENTIEWVRAFRGQQVLLIGDALLDTYFI